jgi:pectate lyase
MGLFVFGTRCYFAQHDKTMLIGADPTHVGDRCIRVTIHHCFFDGTNQRHPRVRFGKVHLYNNYTRNWKVYAICASVESQVILLLSSLAFHFLILHSDLRAAILEIADFSKIILQIYSQCNIYEAGDKKKAYEFYTEKVKYIALHPGFCHILKLLHFIPFSHLNPRLVLW